MNEDRPDPERLLARIKQEENPQSPRAVSRYSSVPWPAWGRPMPCSSRPASARPGPRHRRWLGRDTRSQGNRRPPRRTRGPAPSIVRVPRHDPTRVRSGRSPGRQPQTHPARRTGAHECARCPARKAVAGRRGASGRGDRRLHDVNIQHLESLNDIVTQTTGVVVRETVPDGVLDGADEIELVDITPEDLLERLKEGKVYIPAQAERAMRGFFTQGNLIALRELALRRAAERVDAQLRTYKGDQGIDRGLAASPRGFWSASARAPPLRGSCAPRRGWRRACARSGSSPMWRRPGDPRETEGGSGAGRTDLPPGRAAGGRDRCTLSGLNVSEEILAFARTRNVTKIVVGKPARPWWRYRFFGSVVDDLVRKQRRDRCLRDPRRRGRGTLADLPAHSAPQPARDRISGRSWRSWPWRPVRAGSCSISFAPSNLVMVYLLGVVFVASGAGAGPIACSRRS